MKKLIATIIIGLASTLAADTIAVPEAYFVPPQRIEQINTSFVYFRFAAAEGDVSRATSLVPGLGLGFRTLSGNGAVDISINGLGYAERKNSRYFWTVPKATYIHYFAPDQKESFYLGGGLAWGGVKSSYSDFIGIIPSVTGGYEFARKGTILGFAEVNISQPAIAVYKRDHFPGSIAELTVGVGF